MRVSARSFGIRIMAAALAAIGLAAAASASDFSEPWLRSDRALIIDAYEYNVIDWKELATDERIAGFINKGSDGLPPAYRCSGDDETETALCRALWKRYSVAKELFHTRKAMAKSLGLEWGAYHLGRPGNPIDQANHFIDFAQPGPDDLVALDIEENDPEKWMSLEDAEEFARHIKRRIGRYPVLYTNGSTAKYIAENRDEYPLLSRLPLWYARYKPEIGDHFPKGHWQDYALWQFVSQTNCNERDCPYRPPGTNHDIDVNVASMNVEKLREAWPFDALVEIPEDLPAEEETEELVASVPVPTPRAVALGGGDVTLTYAPVAKPKSVDAFAKVFAKAGAEQDKLADEPDEEAQSVATVAHDEPAADANPKSARGEIKLASAPAKAAATYVRLSVLKAKSAPAAKPIVNETTAKKPPYSNRHIGTAEYIAWRKDSGLPVKLAQAEDPAKSGRLVPEVKAERLADPLDDVKEMPKPETTGSVKVAARSHSADDDSVAVPDQEYPGSSGWFGRVKAYLGLF